MPLSPPNITPESGEPISLVERQQNGQDSDGGLRVADRPGVALVAVTLRTIRNKKALINQ